MTRPAPFRFRLAAVDIDDTLVGHDKVIGDANRRAVRRLIDAGCRVVLASGRRHGNMLRYAKELALTDFVISAQGAMAKHPTTSQVIHYEPLAGPLAEEVIELGLSLGVGVVIFTPDGAFARTPTRWTEQLRQETGGDLAYVDRLPPTRGAAVEKILWCDDPARHPSRLAEIAPRFAAGPGQPTARALLTITDPHLLEFTSPRATKADGLAAVANHYGIAQDDVIAFGDGNNDVPMLGWAGLGVAMSHAHPNAKAAADTVAPPGDPESSLARAVEAILSE